jgi:hypothetical protein
MMNRFFLSWVIGGLGVQAYTPIVKISRRSVLVLPFIAAAAATSSPAAAVALDMDAFASKALESGGKCDEKMDKKCRPNLSDDEALCRFGQPSKEIGEACVRAGMPTAAKKEGGVDAFGKMDRGDFVRCKTRWVDNGVKYIKKRECSDGIVTYL